MPTVTYRGRKAYVRNFIARIPLMLMGRSPDTTRGGVRAFWIKVGLVALVVIKDAYLIRSRGGTDAAGLKWAKLAASTVARRLRKAGLPSQAHAIRVLKAAYLAQSKTNRKLKSLERAKKLAEKVFGPMQILVDTGRLLASFTPGVRSADQRFEMIPGGVIVGSNVKTKSGHNLSAIHHHGTARIPMRKIWPDWDDWPTEWKQQIYDAMQDGLSDLILRWVQSGAKA